jgi:hypothetical protein
MICISLCDRTGVMLRPWAEAGYTCFCVDTRHSIRKDRSEGNLHFVWGDARSWVPPIDDEIAFACAFSPCTHVAVSGARDFLKKGPRMLTDALDLFNSCHQALSWSRAPFMLENPVGTLSTYIRKPDYTFHPCEFAGYLADPIPEAYTKQTCLWTGNGFVMPTSRKVDPIKGSMMHRLPPSEDREDIRSATPRGFALAVFLANEPLVKEKVA